MSKKDIKIFVSHRIDLDSEVIDNPLYVNVRCGAIFDERDNISMIGDDTGDNISHKKKNYSEFTVLYWAWKNQIADYYGLCHYRRYFSFSGIQYDEDINGNVLEDYLNEETIKKYKLDDEEKISEEISSYDYILTKVDVNKQGYKNLYDQYEKAAPFLHIEDLMTAVKVIKEKTPKFYLYAKKYLSGNIFYPCVMFIMRKDIFNGFCEWVFPLMKDIEERLDVEYYNEDEARAIGHIGERLLGVYITYLQEEYPSLISNIHQRVLFWNTKCERAIKPSFKANNIPIVISSSDYYMPYTAVTLRSIMMNLSKGYNCDIIILSTDVSDRNKKILETDLKEYKNKEIRFVDVNKYIENMEFRIGLPHISKETFYRLLIPNIMKEYKKIIFLDCDIVVQGDISELYNMDLEGNPIGAAIDVDFAGEYKGAIEGIKDYVDDTLKLKNPYKYFQAGVLIMDLDAMRENVGDEGSLLEYSNGKEFRYLDQDILNVAFHGCVKYIDLAWNVLSDCDQIRVDKIIKHGPMKYYNDYLDARKKPKIIHYAGDEKPWDSPAMDFAPEFFYYARQSMFYECIILRLGVRHSSIMMNKYIYDNRKDSWIYEHMGGDLYSRFIFPWKAIRPGAKIVIYGGGIVGKTFLRQLANNPYCHVITVVDANPLATGIIESPVISVSELAEMEPHIYDVILIALERKDIALEVRKDMELIGVPVHKIKWVDPHRR